jgi:hypothetical protein
MRKHSSEQCQQEEQKERRGASLFAALGNAELLTISLFLNILR